MKVLIGVSIEKHDFLCGSECAWLDVFGMKPGEEDPVPRCSLCNQFLNDSPQGVQRCGACLDMERHFHEEARREAMRKAVQEKKDGIRLLEATNYKIDITTFESVTELFKYLVERERMPPSLLCEITGLRRDDLETVMKGMEYPYLISVVQAHIGVPAPKHITSDEEMARATQTLRGSDVD